MINNSSIITYCTKILNYWKIICDGKICLYVDRFIFVKIFIWSRTRAFKRGIFIFEIFVRNVFHFAWSKSLSPYRQKYTVSICETMQPSVLFYFITIFWQRAHVHRLTNQKYISISSLFIKLNPLIHTFGLHKRGM